jgi:hypothetical protein
VGSATHQASLLLFTQLCIILWQGLLQMLQRCIHLQATKLLLHGLIRRQKGCQARTACCQFVTADTIAVQLLLNSALLLYCIPGAANRLKSRQLLSLMTP